MGAGFWEHRIDHEPDPEAALRRLQAEVFQAAGIDLAALIEERIADMAEAINGCDSADDRPLLDHYRAALDQLRDLAAAGVPPTANGSVARLRTIEAIGSDSAPGVLAIEGLSAQPAYFLAFCPPAWQVEAICGTARPSAQDARDAVRRLESLDRGMAIALPIFDGDRHVAWYFAGWTAD